MAGFVGGGHVARTRRLHNVRSIAARADAPPRRSRGFNVADIADRQDAGREAVKLARATPETAAPVPHPSM